MAFLAATSHLRNSTSPRSLPRSSSTNRLEMTEENKIKFLEEYKIFVDLHQIMIITHDESIGPIYNYIIRDYISKIKKYKK